MNAVVTNWDKRSTSQLLKAYSMLELNMSAMAPSNRPKASATLAAIESILFKRGV